MNNIGETPTPIQYLTTINGKRIFIKRDDLNHPTIQGNKYRKLKYTLQLAQQNQHTMISFGGAYSNHIAALASAGKYFHLNTVGVIRGEELANRARWSKTLIQAQQDGMKLHFISRISYKDKELHPEISALINNYPNPLIIPEGGSNQLSLRGTGEIIEELTQQPQQFQHLFAACGTGGTLAGLIDGAKTYCFQGKITGVSVLKGGDFLVRDVQTLSQHHQHIHWSLEQDYHFGGYAKSNAELSTFIEQFESHYSIVIEPIYTGKLCYAVFDLARQSPSTQSIENWLIYHSGGLQGNNL